VHEQCSAPSSIWMGPILEPPGDGFAMRDEAGITPAVSRDQRMMGVD
jgi:hypothetical protein